MCDGSIGLRPANWRKISNCSYSDDPNSSALRIHYMSRPQRDYTPSANKRGGAYRSSTSREGELNCERYLDSQAYS